MMASVASNIPFSDLCHLCEKVSVANRDKKREFLKKYRDYFQNYFKTIHKDVPNSVDSFYPVLRLLLPQLDRERGAYGVKEHTLAKIYIRILGIPKDGHDALKLLNFRSPKNAGGQAGDFADVAFFVLKNRCSEGGELSVEQVNTHLDNLAEKHAAHEPRAVDDELMAMLRVMSAKEQKWLIRMLLKDMKLGIGQNAILGVYHPDARELYDVSNNLRKVCELLRDPSVRLHEVEVSVFSPFRPMLAERCDVRQVETMMKERPYYLETKHDGERFQLHMKDGKFQYFSRNGYDYTDTFGTNYSTGVLTYKLAGCFKPNVQSFILDGEMMGWNKNLRSFGTKGQNFDVKTLKPGDVYQPCFCVFDVLLLNDRVLTNKPLQERMSVLENLFTPIEGVIGYTTRRKIASKSEALDALNMAIDDREEGIILKDPLSVYKPNVRKGGWLKIKPEYTDDLMDHLDLLIIGGYYGGGRRRQIISHFLLAVAVPPPQPDEEPNEFHSIARVGSGYSLEELGQLLTKLNPHWHPVKKGECPKGIVWTKEKPDFWIAPENSHIVEVKATEIIEGDGYKTGYTLRFPRVDKVRYDRSWKDCLSTEEFTQLRKLSSGKLYSRHVDDNEESVSPSKRRKVIRATQTITLGSQFQGVDVSSIEQTSTIFAGKEFCIVTGCEEYSKQDLEKLVAQNGGTIVQNPGSNTYVVVASSETIRVKNIARSGKYDVAHAKWFLRCISECSLLPWAPSDLISTSDRTTDILATKFDEFGDSYTIPATTESIREVLKKMEKGATMKLLQHEIAEFDIELFSGPSPYGIFRLCRAYFDKYEELGSCTSEINERLDIVELQFQFLGGRVLQSLDDDVTHVILHSNCLARWPQLHDTNKKRRKKFHVVTEKWIEESATQCKRLEEVLFQPCPPD